MFAKAIFFLSFLMLTGLNLHPIHVSITEINYNEKQKSLEISCQIFMDDFAEILERIHQTKIDFTNLKNKETTETLIANYLSKNLIISNLKKNFALNYIGFEIEKDLVWVYAEVLKVKKIKQIKIQNTLLLDLFKDQNNMLHFKYFEQKKNYPFRVGNESFLFEFE